MSMFGSTSQKRRPGVNPLEHIFLDSLSSCCLFLYIAWGGGRRWRGSQHPVALTTDIPGPSNSGKFLGVLGDPYDLPNSSGSHTICVVSSRALAIESKYTSQLANVPIKTIKCLDHSKLRLFLICGSLLVFARDLRKCAGVLRSKGVRFFCTAQLWTAVAGFDKLAGCINRLSLKASFHLSKAASSAIVCFLGVLGVSGFCGKKCYDFPNIQSKAETTCFFV